MKKRLFSILLALFLTIGTVVTPISTGVSAAATTYDLWVAGTQVTSDTLSGNGWKYEPDTNTLVLNGFAYGSGGYGYRLGYDSGARADIYAFIYVKDTNRKAMSLNIRLEGKESVIGDAYLSGYAAVSIGKNDYETYYGIYNPYGNVTITGSAKLKVYTNQLCINARDLNINGCTGGIDLMAYSACANVYRFNVRDGSKVNAYCGFGGGRMYNTPIHAEKSVNIYDTSEVYSEIERHEKTDDYGICGISCDGTINVYGGKLTGVSWAQGKTPKTSAPACAGIQTKVLNVFGGVVEAFVKQGTSQKSYLKSTGICYYYVGNGTINVKDSGVIRAGVEKKNPDGTQTLLPKTFNEADGVYGYCTALRKDGYEAYVEYTAFAREGAFVRLDGTSKQLSYYRHFRKTSAYPTGDVPALSDVIAAEEGLGLYVLSGEHIFDPRLSDGSVPEIWVESGKLTLKLQDGKTYAMTRPIHLSAGTELVIEGDGVVTGLDIRGRGKVTFGGGTVTGSVVSTVEMVVTGGNIQVDYKGMAKNGSGKAVVGRAYTLTNDKTFARVELIKMRDREYGGTGVYPFDGKTLWLWTDAEGEVQYARAVLSDGKSALTLNSQAGNPLLLEEGFGIQTKDDPVRLVEPGDTIVLDPFAIAPAEEQMKDYRLVWSYGRHDDWKTIENAAANSDARGRLTYYYDPADMVDYNRFIRCEIYSVVTGELVGVYSTLLHVLRPIILSKGDWVEGNEMTLTITERTPIPEGYVKRSSYWYVSKDGGKTFSKIDGTYNPFSYTTTLTEEMEGWKFRCIYRLTPIKGGIGVAADDTITVGTLSGKTVKIDTQPVETVLDLDDPDGSATLTVGARNAAHYQWQVAKRTNADQTDATFENIPDATEASYTLRSADADLSMRCYVYRCVVSNDVNEVISDEVSFDFRCLPSLWETPDMTEITLFKEESATLAVTVNPGLPQVTNRHVYWQVSADGGKTYKSVYEYRYDARLWDNLQEATTTVTPEGQSITCIRYRLEIVSATEAMSGLIFRCCYKLSPNQEYQVTEPITLTVKDKCTENGHIGGTATCRSRAICERCGSAYGEVDSDNHTGTLDWDKSQWNIANTHWKTWSCCHKQVDEAVHTFENGACTVCGCVCDHALKKKATCYEEGSCYICGMKTEEKNPDNHDLWLGTYTRGKEEPTCTEAGYTGDVCCFACHGVITQGAVIPANGHSDSWPATCKYPAYCSVCRQWFGDKDPNNHDEPWSAYYTNVTETTHEEHWNCCAMVKTLPHDLDEHGVCKDCHYGCQHTGGRANCVEQAHCEKCGEPYGDLDPNNHELTMIYPDDDNTHTERCKCGKILSGPDPHTWENGECTVCYVSHWDHTESDWIVEEEPAFGKSGARRTECTVCHMLMAYESLAALGFEDIKVGHNCSFGNDLSMLYAIRRSDLDGCEDIRLVVEKERYKGNTLAESTAETLTPTACTINGERYYRFDYRGVAAKELGNKLTATLTFTRDGVAYSGTVDTYSLKGYAMERLEASKSDEFKTLLVDLLNYGAAAQTYFEYRTDALVNADLTDEQRALSRGGYAPLAVVENDADSGIYPASIKNRNFCFGNRIEPLVVTSFEKDSDLDGVSLRVRYTDYTGQQVERFVTEFEYLDKGDVKGYAASFDGLKASELRTELELTLIRDGKAISKTMKYSFDAYAKNRMDNSTDENFKELLEKTLIYSDSAKTYFNKTTN